MIGGAAFAAQHRQQDVVGAHFAEQNQEVVPVVEHVEFRFDRIFRLEANLAQRRGGGIEDHFRMGIATHVPHFPYPEGESQLLFGPIRNENQ